MQYSQVVEQHFDCPRNVGVLHGDRRSIGIGLAGSIEDGAQVEFQMRFAGGTVEKATFRAYGCPCTIAMASWMTERVQGLSVQAVESLDPHELAAEIGLPPEKLTRALLVEDAVKMGLEDWRCRQPTSTGKQ